MQAQVQVKVLHKEVQILINKEGHHLRIGVHLQVIQIIEVLHHKIVVHHLVIQITRVHHQDKDLHKDQCIQDRDHRDQIQVAKEQEIYLDSPMQIH